MKGNENGSRTLLDTQFVEPSLSGPKQSEATDPKM